MWIGMRELLICDKRHVFYAYWMHGKGVVICRNIQSTICGTLHDKYCANSATRIARKLAVFTKSMPTQKSGTYLRQAKAKFKDAEHCRRDGVRVDSVP